jgi:ATP-dependent DNA ligase
MSSAPGRENGPMKLPVMPPVSPMLSKSVGPIPSGASYEPKWDGFRSICFRDGDEVELGSRNERPMTRYFPELVAAAVTELPEHCVIDGEINQTHKATLVGSVMTRMRPTPPYRTEAPEVRPSCRCSSCRPNSSPNRDRGLFSWRWRARGRRHDCGRARSL